MPDDAFVARLSTLAAAGASAPQGKAVPIATWRVALAAASVAAVLVGIAWLTGLSPSGSSDPAPPPTTRPSAPHQTTTSVAIGTSADSVDSPTTAVPPPGGLPAGEPGHGGRPGRLDEPGSAAGSGQGIGHSVSNNPDKGAGGDTNAESDEGNGTAKHHGLGHAYGHQQNHGRGHAYGHEQHHGHGHAYGHEQHAGTGPGRGTEDRPSR
jgi:hypothetical protein